MKCRNARQLISLHIAPEETWLSQRDRDALKVHLAQCEACRLEYREGRKTVRVLREHWPISADTAALLKQRPEPKAPAPSTGFIVLRQASRRAAIWAAAACLVLAGLGGWAFVNHKSSSTGPDRPAAFEDKNVPLVIELANGGHIAPGSTVQTSTSETKRLVLNGRHKVVMNAGTELAIQPLVERGRVGYRMDLARGEICVHVAHDGNPFVVQTAHGRAVITGTTFGVQTTEAATTLVVAEGSVRFESETGAVQVIAGHSSKIMTSRAVPSPPAPCDSVALTAWAFPTEQEEWVPQDIQAVPSLSGDVLATPTPWTEIRVDPDRIDYAQWVEEKRDWFRQQFPWIFKLKEALARDGIEVDYPELLMQSQGIWRFAYPQADLGRQIAPDPNDLLHAAAHYDRDESWLRQQFFSLVQATGLARQTTGADAFERWVDSVETYASTCSEEAESGVLLDTSNASLYLINTRVLAILEIRRGCETISPQDRNEVLGLLANEIRILVECVDLSQELSLRGLGADSCECSDKLQNLTSEIRELGELEKRVRSHEKLISR